MKRRRELLFVSFLVLTGYAFPQNYNFTTFSTEEGLAQSYVYSVIQDHHGYLWIGTGNGLSRYDGFTFENYTTSDSLAGNFVTSGICDGEHLWFGHDNGGLSFFNGRVFRKVKTPQPDLSRITHFAKNQDGNIWVSTYSDGLINLGKDTVGLRSYVFKEQIIITCFSFLADNELIIGTNSGLLYCKLTEPGKIEIIGSVEEIAESKVTCIQKMKAGDGFYVATENEGIFILTLKDNLLGVLKIFSEHDSVITGIQDIYEDNQLNLWLGSFGNGLIRISTPAPGELSEIAFYNPANGFASDNVKSVFEDREGNIWCGNYGKGLTLITPKTFRVLEFEKGSIGNNIFSFCITGEAKWIGTENGLIKMDQLTEKFIKFYGKGSGLPKDTVTAIYSADGKELWIGTGKNGVFRMDTGNEKIIKYSLEEGALENSVTAITGSREQIWIGTKKGLNNINTVSDKITRYTISQGGLPHNNINCLLIDKSDRLWVTTSSSILSYIQDEKVFKMPVNSGDGNSALGPITEDRDSRIWVGSKGNGVFLIESDSILNLTVKQGLFSNYCYSLICDENSNVWIGHRGGLSRIQATSYLVKSVQYIENITDSYQFNPNSVIRDQQEKIWFGSDRGIVFYDPSMEYPWFLPPVLVITSIRVNNIEKDPHHKIVLAPGNYKIGIGFLGVSLRDPALVTYQYKMEGHDDWSDITKNTFVTYKLNEGDYTFILKASSGDGAVSETPLTVGFSIRMPVWKKWWFYPVTVILLITMALIYIKRREYKFMSEKKILEEKVVERTFEIQSQKDEIELQRDQIDEKNASITSSIKYASHIQNAILPPHELIEELLPHSFILNIPKDIVSGDFYWLAEKDGKIVFVVADCTGHGVPGAFMSFLGITLLNSLVNIQGFTRSDEIVTKLRERVVHALQQGRKDIPTTDGMDIALCVLDRHTNTIQYTGGMNNLIYIRDGKVEVIKADRFSVCAVNNSEDIFTMKEIAFRNGDIFYLFSDGYKDQFGGNFDKKYLVPHFYLTLLEIHKLPMDKQKEILEKKLFEWMKGGVQTDDVTVMGVRL